MQTKNYFTAGRHCIGGQNASSQQRVSAIAGDKQVESFLLSITFVAWDSFVILKPQHQKPAKRYGQFENTTHLTLKNIITFVIFLPTLSFGQQLDDSLLATFYNKTLVYYFSDTTTYKANTKFGCILLEIDFDTSKLIKNFGTNKFKFFSSKTDKQSVLDKPFKKNKGRSIYWINHKTFGQDTVDINIGGWTIGDVKKKSISFGAWCGGTMGYIPDARFIYNTATNTWIFISSKEIIEQKLTE